LTGGFQGRDLAPEPFGLSSVFRLGLQGVEGQDNRDHEEDPGRSEEDSE
jgi:hypothetical protein